MFNGSTGHGCLLNILIVVGLLWAVGMLLGYAGKWIGI